MDETGLLMGKDCRPRIIGLKSIWKKVEFTKAISH